MPTTSRHTHAVHQGRLQGRGSVTQGEFPYLTIASYLLSPDAFFCALNAPKLVCNRGSEPPPHSWPPLRFSTLRDRASGCCFGGWFLLAGDRRPCNRPRYWVST